MAPDSSVSRSHVDAAGNTFSGVAQPRYFTEVR